MRKLIGSLLVVLIIAGVAPYTLPLKNGEPLLKWSDVSIPKLPKLPDLPKIPKFNEAEPQSITTYKWRDSAGNWHLGDTPPQNVAYETIVVNPDVNLLPAITPTTVAEEPPPETVKETTPQSDYSPAMAYDPQKVKEVMDSARNVENLLQQRQERQDKALKAIQ